MNSLSHRFLCSLLLLVLLAGLGSAQHGAQCWGFPDYYSAFAGLEGSASGLLVNPNLSPLPGQEFAQVIAGQYITCTLTTAGAINCWTNPTYAGLLGGVYEFFGLGNWWQEYTFTSIALSQGVDQWSVCGIYSVNGKGVMNNLWCEGAVLNTEVSLAPYPAVSSSVPQQHVWSTAQNALCLGQGYACALTTKGGVLCWGESDSTQGFSPVLNPVAASAPSTGTFSYLSCGANFAVGLQVASSPSPSPSASPGATPTLTPGTIVIWPLSYVQGWGSPSPSPNAEYNPIPAWGTTGTPFPSAIAIQAGNDHFCYIGSGASAHLHCYGLSVAIAGAPATNIVSTLPFGADGPLNPFVFSMGAFGGCVQSANPSPNPSPPAVSPFCWFADYYLLPAENPAPQTFQTPMATMFASISGGNDYFCGTW